MLKIAAGEVVPEKIKEWFRPDLRHVEDWRQEARTDYEFRDGHQWTDDEVSTLEAQSRPVITINRIGMVIDAVSGSEIGARQEVRYIPREEGDGKANELLTSAALWFRDQADADDNDTEAFRDTLTGGMGWTETRIDHESNTSGDMAVERLNPFEMLWDYNARKRNLTDANRVWRVRSIPIDDARALFPEFGDDDLNAGWASEAVFDGDMPHVAEAVRDRTKSSRGEGGELTEVVIVHLQWAESESVYRIVAPDGQTVMATKEELEALKAGTGMTDEELSAVPQKRKKRYQAFLGNVVLKTGETAAPKQFNFQCITGKRDQTKGQWYGLVRPMRDPQSWSNKFFSQILHIINSNAKGGIVAERTAFENAADAEASWSKSDRITWMSSGALSGANPKFREKPQSQFPSGLQYMLEFAVSSTRDVVGVSLEMLGMREANQAGVLEYQRRQSGMTILQPLFDSLKSYRREQGELILHYIQNDLSDGRLIRILGQNEAQYAPLIKQANLEYDIVVDDMPTSPNHKEMVWNMLTQIMPYLKDMMTPEVMLRLAKWSPLPTAVVEDIKELHEQAGQGPMVELEQRMATLEAALKEADVGLKQAQANKANADAQATKMETGQGNGQPGADDGLSKAMDAVGKHQVKLAEVEAAAGLKRSTADGDMELKRDIATADANLKAEGMSFDQTVKANEAEMKARLAAMKAGQGI